MARARTRLAEAVTVPVVVPPQARELGNQFPSSGTTREARRGKAQFPEPMGTTGTTPGLSFEPLAAFLERTRDLPPPTWLVGALVPDRGRLFVAAAPNAGKTFLALLIAKAAGERGRPTYLVLEEGGARALRDRLVNLALPRDAPIHIAHLAGFRLADDEAIVHLAQQLGRSVAPVLVLDPFASIFLGDENDTRQVNQAKERLEYLVRANPDTLLVLLHHTSKGGESGANTGQYAARGSSILPAWADFTLILRHEEVPKGSGRVCFMAKVEKNRDGERDYQLRVTIELGTGTFTVDDAAAGTEARAQAIRAFLEAKPGATKNQIYEQVRGRKKDVLELIDRLVRNGEVVNDGSGYRLADEDVAEAVADG